MTGSSSFIDSGGTFTDRSNDTKTDKNRQTKKCHMSCVTCCVSPVTSANTHSNRPFPLVTPPLFKGGWFAKTQKPNKYSNDKKSRKRENLTIFRGMPILAIHFCTLCHQSTEKHYFQPWTDRQTYTMSHTLQLIACRFLEKQICSNIRL